MENGLEQQVLAKAQKWLDGNYDAETKKQVKYLMDNDMKELVESFYKDLEFGTGGLRGVMGVGTNRMNIYTVGAATQGLSNYLKRNFAGEEIRVVVGHDSRNNSRMFAERVADIFASNGFTVFLFDALRPTPELSFAIRELKCQSGVVVTASHNPKEYNGYKAYWSDGSQVTAPHDKNIIDEVEKITEVDQVLTGRNPQNIHALGKDFDELYLNKIYELSLSSESVKRFHDMKIVYSPMHGAGVRLVPESLKRFGFTNVQMVPEQAVIDGNFPTVESPNPEERKTMSMAIDLAKKVKADLVLATDPDSDRIGVALPDENGEYVLLNGNQTLVLLMTYQLTRWAELGRLNGHQYVIKTIVTTEMVDAVADYFKVKCYECLTGFKYIAKIIRGHEGTDMQYIGGGEESFGYLAGDYVRDKDGVSDAVFKMLDFAGIGRMMRCSENGVFVGSLYVLQDGELTTAPPVQKTLPEKPGYLFRLTLGLHPDIGDAHTVTLDLPAAEAELLDAQEQLGVEGWEGVTVIDYDGIIPYAAEFTELPMELEELNAFTKAARDISRSEVPKLKALLEQFEVQDIETAMLLTEHLADYILMPNLSSPQEAALDQLCFIMNREEAVRLIPYVNLFNYGETVIHADNAALTSYGLLHRADYEPMLSPIQQKQEKEMTMQ